MATNPPAEFSAPTFAASPYADDARSLRDRALALEAADVPTPTQRCDWHPTTVARVVAQLAATSMRTDPGSTVAA